MKTPEYLEKAETLSKQDMDIETLVTYIKKYLDDHFHMLKIRYKPKSILESRFTPSSIAYKIGMISCGSLTNIMTDMLRHLGYEVKKVHGSTPRSSDHTWVKVKDGGSGEWVPFDITQKDCQVTPDHKEIAQCNEWDEIEDEIIRAHLAGSPQSQPKEEEKRV